MKKGFTLIELLAVIVVLAIIAVIATPIIINIIDDAKESSTLRSSELYMSAVELAIAKASSNNIDITTCTVDDNNLKCGEKVYEIKIDGEIPEEVEIKATKEGEINAVIKTNGYCIVKKEDGYSYKKVVDRVNDDEKEITNNMCALNPYTSENCFEFDEQAGTITKYYSYENDNKTNPVCPRDVVIPKKINNTIVISIGNSAFYRKDIKNVELPNTITSIGNAAFRNNYLTNLNIPKGVKNLGGEAFADNSIINLTLPSTLTTISNHAFRNNKLPQDQAYIYKRNNDGSIDYSTIIGYGGESKDITLPKEKNGVKLTTISNSAFYNNGLKNVELPNTITSIGNAAFRKNNLTSLIIPKGVQKLEGEAFANNLIKELTLPSTLISIGNHAFRNNKLPQDQAFIYKRNSDGSIDYSTIIGYGGESKDITLPKEKNGVKLTTIDVYAFYNNGLVKIELPDTITLIKNDSFGKNKLTDIVIPNSVISISGAAFSGNSLTSVTIKNKKENVTIGNNAFGSFDINNIVWEG